MNLPNIVLTREILEDCLLNSKPFRDAVLDQIVISQKPRLHTELLKLMKTCYFRDTKGEYSIGKIQFIKGMREMSSDRLDDFISEYSGIVSPSNYAGPNAMTCLGLADSKHLAEHYIGLFDRTCKPSY